MQNRRSFLTSTLGAAALTGAARAQNQPTAPGEQSPFETTEAGNAVYNPQTLQRPKETRRADMLYRAFGQTGVEVSAIGLGGSDIGKAQSQDMATRIVRTAVDHGITYMDNSWDYNNGDGQGETKMGNALRDGYRQKVFLMTKADGRTKQSAMQQLEQSLKRLQTDHVDLWQFHETIRMEDADRFFAPGGAREAFEQAKQQGKIRFIGFTGHKDPVIHLRMFDMAKQNGFHFDAVLFPSNVMDWHFRSFVHQVMPRAIHEGTAVQTMKPFGAGHVLKSGVVTPEEALHYALAQPASVVINGMNKMEDLNQALAAVKSYQPMNREQILAITKKTRDAAAKGQFELFKTTMQFDSTAHHPEWLGEMKTAG